MRSALPALGLAVAALLPTLPTPVPSTLDGSASATVPATVPAAVPIWAGRPGQPIAVKADDMPTPPPVNMNRLPVNWRPSPAPGVSKAEGCARPSPLLTSAAQADPLLWGNRLFRLPELWRSAGSRGAGIKLAVIDTGVAAHQLLAGRLFGAGDYVSTEDGSQDCDGHGTAVAGIAAAAPDTVTGFSGIAPEATVLAIRQTSGNFNWTPQDDQTNTGVGDIRTLARAIMDAVNQGANVINMSVVSCQRSPVDPADAELQAALHFAVENNVVVVAAAGNAGEANCPQTSDNTTVVLPGWYDQDVLTVGAINQSEVVAAFSYPGPWVDVAAPGENLMSLSLGGLGVTQWAHDLRESSTDNPSQMQGTSFASPAVAGLAVLIRAKYPQLTARQVMDRITATARSSGSRDWGIGYGVVDPLAALNKLPAVLPPPAATQATEGTLNLKPSRAANRGTTGALWGGVLGLLAVLAALALGIGKARQPGSPQRRRR